MEQIAVALSYHSVEHNEGDGQSQVPQHNLVGVDHRNNRDSNEIVHHGTREETSPQRQRQP